MDRHHVLFNKREWESRPQYKELRSNSGLIIPMDREVHCELHRASPIVPVMGYYGIMSVNREFYRGRDHLETLDNLLFALDASSKNEKLSNMERSLSSLALEAVEIQKPLIKEGYIKPPSLRQGKRITWKSGKKSQVIVNTKLPTQEEYVIRNTRKYVFLHSTMDTLDTEQPMTQVVSKR